MGMDMRMITIRICIRIKDIFCVSLYEVSRAIFQSSIENVLAGEGKVK